MPRTGTANLPYWRINPETDTMEQVDANGRVISPTPVPAPPPPPNPPRRGRTVPAPDIAPVDEEDWQYTASYTHPTPTGRDGSGQPNPPAEIRLPHTTEVKIVVRFDRQTGTKVIRLDWQQLVRLNPAMRTERINQVMAEAFAGVEDELLRRIHEYGNNFERQAEANRERNGSSSAESGSNGAGNGGRGGSQRDLTPAEIDRELGRVLADSFVGSAGDSSPSSGEGSGTVTVGNINRGSEHGTS